MSTPKGALVAIGGNEDKEFAKAVLKRVVELPEGGSRRVALIPTASSVPKELTADYEKAFTKLGIEKLDVLDIRAREDAEDRKLAELVRESDVVFFTGGDQLRLTSLLGGTRLCEAIHAHYRNGGVVAGTSAGAAAMSSTMIFQSKEGRPMTKGSVHMTPGLALLPTCVIDTHFLDRGRLSRLLEIVSSNPGHLGVGLGEDTGVIVRGGDHLDVIGSGIVVLVEGTDIRHTNISAIEDGDSIATQNLLVHTLPEGYGFQITSRKYILPKENGEDAA
jgi:cyanophycinase